MAKYELKRILNEVDLMLKTNYYRDEADPKNLSVKAYELYKLLTTAYVEPIRLSQLIEGYKDSDNPDDDFTINNSTLIDFIRHDSHKYITERLKIQLAYYFCRKHLYICKLYLYYLNLITDKEHQHYSNHKIKDYDILHDLSELQVYCFDSNLNERAIFLSSVANRITQEYLSEFSILPF